MMAQILMHFCDQKHNAWQYIVKQHTGQDQRPRPILESAKTKSKTKLDMTAKLGRITHNNGHFAVQCHSRSPILVPIVSSYTASYSKTIARQVLRIKSWIYKCAKNLYRGRRAVPLQTFITRHGNRILSIVLALSTTFTQFAPETTKVVKITQNKGHFVDQGHSRSPILYQSKAHIRLPISD